MRLTTKGRFAVTAMIDIALRQSAGLVALAGVAERQNISLSYLEQLFAKLRKKALVEAVRGPGGGYRLGHAARDINVAAIINAVDEGVDATNCAGKHDCGSDGRECMTHGLWNALTDHMHQFLAGVSLEHLVNEQIAHGWDTETLQFKRKSAMSLTNPPQQSIKMVAPNSVFNLGNFGHLSRDGQK